MRKVFYALPPAELAELVNRVQQEAWERKLIYERNGQMETIPLLLRPSAAMPDQLSYLHFVSLTLLNALKRLPEMYLADAEIRRIVQLSEAEEAWLRESWGPSQRDNNPVFGRLDGVIEFTSPMWKDSLRFIEPNLSGVGGIHLAPTCDGLIADFRHSGAQNDRSHVAIGTRQRFARAVHSRSAGTFGSDRPARAACLFRRAQVCRYRHR